MSDRLALIAASVVDSAFVHIAGDLVLSIAGRRAIEILAAAMQVAEHDHAEESGVRHLIPDHEVPKLPGHMAKAYRVAFAILGNEWDALDAVASALLVVVRHPCEPTDFGQTLCRITRFKSLDIVRRRKRRNGEVSFNEEYHQRAPSNDEEMCEHIARLRESVKALPADYKKVVELHYFEGKSHDEIAEQLGTTKGAVNMRLHKARKLLSCAVLA